MEDKKERLKQAIEKIMVSNNLYNLPRDNSKIYGDFILNLLMKSRKNIAKVDILTLRKNSIYDSLRRFFEIEYTIRCNYTEVLEKTNNYYVLRITESGKRAYQFNCAKSRVYIPNRFTRFFIWLSKVGKVLGKFLFTSLPKGVKKFLDSAFAKSISYLITLVSISIVLIVNWDKIKDFLSKHF